MHEVLVNRLGGLSLPRKSVVRLTDRPDMTLDVYRGRKTTIQPTNQWIIGGAKGYVGLPLKLLGGGGGLPPWPLSSYAYLIGLNTVTNALEESI